MKDLGEIKLFLGISVTRRKNVICLHQSQYIRKLLGQYNMLNCKSSETPLPSKLDWEKLQSEELYDKRCQSLLGSLMYLMICTRPDLSFTVNVLSRFVSKNNKQVWEYLWVVLRYLKGTIDLKLTYEKNTESNFEVLLGYVDADWANDTSCRKSTTGYVFKLYENCCVTWNTRKQNSVADSSTAAEYMALHEGTKEALWLKSLGATVNLNVKYVILYEDNLGCISIAEDPRDHKRTKHIDVKYHFVRDEVESKNVKLIYICSENQIADMFTKPLDRIKFFKFRDQLGLK